MCKELIIATPIFLILDFVFLASQRKTFETQVISVQKTALVMKPAGAIACYLFLLAGLYYFILRERRTPLEAMLFGLVIYGVYETTTYALLKNWKVETVFVDVLWGGVLFYLTTFLTYWISKKI
jgi:uncharacterized membrane protein